MAVRPGPLRYSEVTPSNKTNRIEIMRNKNWLTHIIRQALPYCVEFDLTQPVWRVQVLGREYKVLIAYESSNRPYRRKPSKPQLRMWTKDSTTRYDTKKELDTATPFTLWFYYDGTIPTVSTGESYLRKLSSFGQWLENNHLRGWTILRTGADRDDKCRSVRLN